MFFQRKKLEMPRPETALKGRPIRFRPPSAMW